MARRVPQGVAYTNKIVKNGELLAGKVKDTNGKYLYFGDYEHIFTLRLTVKDKKYLKDLRIAYDDDQGSKSDNN